MNGYITRGYSFRELGGRGYSLRYRRLREFFLDKELLFSSCLANWVGGVTHFIRDV